MDTLCFIFGFMGMPILWFSGVAYGEKQKAPINNPKYYSIIWLITGVMAATGLSALYFSPVRGDVYLFLICPLYSFTVYRLLHKWFMYKMKRDPIPTYREKNDKYDWDVAFQLCFLLLSLLVPIGMLGLFS